MTDSSLKTTCEDLVLSPDTSEEQDGCAGEAVEVKIRLRNSFSENHEQFRMKEVEGRCLFVFSSSTRSHVRASRQDVAPETGVLQTGGVYQVAKPSPLVLPSSSKVLDYISLDHVI